MTGARYFCGVINSWGYICAATFLKPPHVTPTTSTRIPARAGWQADRIAGRQLKWQAASLKGEMQVTEKRRERQAGRQAQKVDNNNGRDEKRGQVVNNTEEWENAHLTGCVASKWSGRLQCWQYGLQR